MVPLIQSLHFLYKAYAGESVDLSCKVLFPGFASTQEMKQINEGDKIIVQLADGTRLEPKTLGQTFLPHLQQVP